ncbi:MAG: GntR family transcriptional regulator [Sedimenticola selenatireducens]|uniref:GntR family transcriptional regulator n=2 Tax=Sedimenticola selenatireducens TaxID=191960 RepID=A0A557SKC9_9GAMM|nr:GntR family transcriptional regulator [Sedimenticola selenatireducens]TVT65191.1 MAG: GntR family transcriptional regulator [Sedimenticola selenatireducens]
MEKGMTKKVEQQKKSSKQSFSDHAYSELKRRILENEISMGNQYMEQEVAELLNMSRTPVREALIKLANEGLVEIRPRHGMRIKPVSLKDMAEICEVLTSLESTAAALTAKRNLSETDIERMKQAVVDMDKALDKDDLDAWAKADERFHKLLVSLSGNERLAALVDTYYDQSHRFRMLTLRLRPKPVNSNKDHRETLEAIIRGDADAARQTHRKHREQSGKMMVELLKGHGLNQL